MERDGNEVYSVALAAIADPDHPPGGEEKGSGGLQRAGGECKLGSAIDTDELLAIGRLEAGCSVGSDVGEGVEAEDHVCVNGRSGEGFGGFQTLEVWVRRGLITLMFILFLLFFQTRQKLPRATKNVLHLKIVRFV